MLKETVQQTSCSFEYPFSHPRRRQSLPAPVAHRPADALNPTSRDDPRLGSSQAGQY